MRRPRIPDDLGERIDQARGQVPFERYVRGLIEIGLDEVKAHEHDTPPPAVVMPNEAARQPRRPPPSEAQAPEIEPTPLPKFAPRRS